MEQFWQESHSLPRFLYFLSLIALQKWQQCHLNVDTDEFYLGETADMQAVVVTYLTIEFLQEVSQMWKKNNRKKITTAPL